MAVGSRGFFGTVSGALLVSGPGVLCGLVADRAGIGQTGACRSAVGGAPVDGDRFDPRGIATKAR